MKKRLRKKKHLDEFTEWGRQLIIVRNRKDGFDEFFDAFIEEAIEPNGCCCGGGGKEDKLDVVVELGRRSDDPDVKLKKITAWLGARPDVEKWGSSTRKVEFRKVDKEAMIPHPWPQAGTSAKSVKAMPLRGWLRQALTDLPGSCPAESRAMGGDASGGGSGQGCSSSSGRLPNSTSNVEEAQFSIGYFYFKRDSLVQYYL